MANPPPSPFGLQQMLESLGTQGVSKQPQLPLMRPIVPGVPPQPSAGGTTTPPPSAMEILALMRQPKLGIRK